MKWALGALGLYLLAAFLLFAVPVLGDSGGLIGSNAPDARLFTWSLGYWPHALTHGDGLLETDAIYAPDGYHLFWTTTVPLIALAMWPVNALFGVNVAYDTALVLGPALSAFTAFLLCRELTARPLPSLLGGWLFGFSSYVLATTAGGHLHVQWVMLFPLAALLIVRLARGRLGGGAYVAALVVLLLAQFLISTEMTLVLAIVAAPSLIAAWIALPAWRPQLTRVLKLSLLAGVVAAVVASPLLISILSGGQRLHIPTETGVIDFLNPPFPTELTWAGHGTFADLSARYVGNPYTKGGYLGVALLLLVFLWGARAWQRGSREERLLLGLGAAALVLALGAALKVTGLTTIPLPWKPFSKLPLLEYVLPYRFMAAAILAIAVAAALWLARDGRHARWRWALAIVAVLLLLPNAGSALYHHQQPIPAFFTSGAYTSVLQPTDRVFALPYGVYGPSMAWQEAADYDFELVGGYVSEPPASYEAPVIQELNQAERFDPADTDALRAFLREKGVTVILVDAAAPGVGPEVIRALGLTARDEGGVLVARL